MALTNSSSQFYISKNIGCTGSNGVITIIVTITVTVIIVVAVGGVTIITTTVVCIYLFLICSI